MQETLSANRMDLLNKQKKNNKKAVPNVLETKFNPCIKGLRKRLMKYRDNIQHDEVRKIFFTTPPVVAWSGHGSVGDLVVGSKLEPNEVRRD